MNRPYLALDVRAHNSQCPHHAYLSMPSPQIKNSLGSPWSYLNPWMEEAHRLVYDSLVVKSKDQLKTRKHIGSFAADQQRLQANHNSGKLNNQSGWR
eukprot:scaffold223578_cov15-Prasinocladus_malaysianus.AAC.1